ncbi:MAG: hypothetical protein KA140_03485 [Caldisericia bacterium]|nr:hypothetical protein [Caldisericia bacterium]
MKKLILMLAIVALIAPPVGLRAATEYRTFIITADSQMISVDGDSFVATSIPYVTTRKEYELVAPENKLMMSILDLSKLVGGKTDFASNRRNLVYKFCDNTVVFEYGKSQVVVNDKTVSVPIGVVIDTGRTVISPKVFCDLFGYPSQYNEETKSLTFKLPICPWEADDKSVSNVYAKVINPQFQSGRMLIEDFTGGVLEVDTKGVNETFKTGDMVHAYMQYDSTDKVFAPYVLEKIDVGFGGSIVKVYNDKKLVEIDNVSTNVNYVNKTIEGESYIAVETLAKIVNSSVMPGDLNKGQLIFSMYPSKKIQLYIDGKTVEVVDVPTKQTQTYELDNPCKLVNGVAYVPVAVLTKCLGGTVRNQDESSATIVLGWSKSYRYSYGNPDTVTVDSLDCSKKTATIVLSDNSKIPVVILPLGDKYKCDELKTDKLYQAFVDKVVKNDGSVVAFMIAWGDTYDKSLNDTSKRVVVGTVTEIIDQKTMELKLEDSDEVLTVMGYVQQIKVGWKLRILTVGGLSKGKTYFIDYAVLDPTTSLTMKTYSLVLSNNEGAWTGKDDSGKTYNLQFKQMPWDVNRYLQVGAKYIINGLENVAGTISVSDFLKSNLSILTRNKLDLYPPDGTQSSKIQYAFKYNGKTYVNCYLVLRSIVNGYEKISYTDNELNPASLDIGSKTAFFKGKDVELSNYPITLGYGTYTYIEASDAAKISDAIIEETDDGKSVIVSKQETRWITTNDFDTIATIDSIDNDMQTMSATGEFGGKVNLLFMDKDSMAGLEVGKSYAFACKNHDWKDFIVFKSLGEEKMPDSRERSIVIGTIDSIDCQKQTFMVKDDKGKLYECLLKKDDNDCSLLKTGYNVVADVLKNEDGTHELIKKWHFAEPVKVKTSSTILSPGEPIKDAATEKPVNEKAKVTMIDGKYYVDFNGISSIFKGSLLYKQTNLNIKVRIWGNTATFWLDRDMCAINGKLTKMDRPITKGDSGSMLLPVDILVGMAGGSIKDGKDANSKIVDVQTCPVPVYSEYNPGGTLTMPVVKAEGLDIHVSALVTGKTPMKLRVSDLRMVQEINVGSCVSLKNIYFSFNGQDIDEIFATVEKVGECK